MASKATMGVGYVSEGRQTGLVDMEGPYGKNGDVAARWVA